VWYIGEGTACTLAMSVSLGGFRKSSTCSILCCTLVFLFGLLLAQAARTEDQQPLLADEDVALGPVFGPVFGIDLGTSYSRISVMKDGLVEIIPDAHGKSLCTNALIRSLTCSLCRKPLHAFLGGFH
jgi:hypothetical protein